MVLGCSRGDFCQGVKVKDDEALLKKKVSKKLKVKAKRTEKWNKRAQVMTHTRMHARVLMRVHERAPSTRA